MMDEHDDKLRKFTLSQTNWGSDGCGILSREKEAHLWAWLTYGNVLRARPSPRLPETHTNDT
jgi:hypothetical protein